MDNSTVPEKKFQVTIVSHTHWDRAWYVTFQEFRARLVRLVDRLIKLLQSDPQYRVFMLDGQMAVLEDYLEVRPQRQPELVKLCLEGRLKVGPWYVLADEFLVSPEALIRNLQLGFRMGEAYGGVSKIGYVPDGFGHISQLPQILRGFGIDSAFFWRGLGDEGEQLGTEFIWEAPDGSRVTTIWMPHGYHNISNLGFGIHWGDTSQMQFDPDLALTQMRSALDLLLPMANTNLLLLMNGIDHEEAEPRLPAMTALANQRLSPFDFKQGSLEEHLAQVKATPSILPTYRGEFRWGKYSEILQGVYATRIHLKQRNHQVETLFERYTEPLSALAWLGGAEVPEGTPDLLWTGWRWLLKNHPHDDIYGSGIDAVHEEMLHRFDQAEQIGNLIVRDSVRQLASRIDCTHQAGIPVLVFNPLGWTRNEMVIGDIDFEFDDPTADSFTLVGTNGEEVPYQVLSDEMLFWMETLKANRKRRLRIAFPGQVPPCGYAFYTIKPGGQPQPEGTHFPKQLDQIWPVSESLAIQELWAVAKDGAENTYLRFRLNVNGDLDVFDKTSGVIYPGLAHFEDIEDIGDEYSTCSFLASELISTRGVPPTVKVVEAGPCQITLEVVRALQIPVGLTEERTDRSPDTRLTWFRSYLTLYRDQPGLFIRTEVDNQSRDHKLSVVFPTGMNPDVVHVDEPFMVIPRPIDLPDSNGWVEDPTPLMHQRSFTDISESGHGLAIFNRGLPAVEVTRGSDGVQAALTLLRSVGWLSRDDLRTRRVAAGPLVPTPGAQCLGKYHFDYAIFPHTGDWRAVYTPAAEYTAPLLAVRADTHEGLNLREMNITRDDPEKVKTLPWDRSGVLPDRASFFRLDRSELVLSSLHRAYDGQGLILRFYNITSEPINARLTSLLPVREAWRVNFNEEKLGNIPLLDDYSCAIPASGCQVITLRLDFNP